MGPALAHKSLESMFVFEQTLLDQTGQESLVGSEEGKKKQMKTKTKQTTCTELYERWITVTLLLKSRQSSGCTPQKLSLTKYVHNYVHPKPIIKQPQTCHFIFVFFHTE